MSNHNSLSQTRWNGGGSGQPVSSRNTVKATLTGQTVLLPTDDADRYGSHIESFRTEWAPEGQRELYLVQSVANAEWRLERIAGFEMAIYATERTFLANAYDDEPEALRATLIDLQVHRIHEKEFRNLALQESRIRRQRDRDISELRYLQGERKRLIEERLALAAEAMKQAKAENKPFDPSEFGFVFSTAEIERFLTLQKLRKNITEAKALLQTCPRGRSKLA